MQEAAEAAAAEKQALEGERDAARAEIRELEAGLEQRLSELEAKQTDVEQQLVARHDAARRAQQALAVALKVLD
jgi:phage-related minor tail protein